MVGLYSKTLSKEGERGGVREGEEKGRKKGLEQTPPHPDQGTIYSETLAPLASLPLPNSVSHYDPYPDSQGRTVYKDKTALSGQTTPGGEAAGLHVAPGVVFPKPPM